MFLRRHSIYEVSQHFLVHLVKLPPPILKLKGDEVDISQDIKLTAMQEKSQVSIKAFCQTNKITYAQVANCT
ncbi:hypothetical protein, partial [Helicobacter sp. 11S02629-2]|uniref:hypothetical protein n=1 Tax=Helicobacter sp. 11S02629-2 TaxID=1476195 RepID=UPI001C5E1ABA